MTQALGRVVAVIAGLLLVGLGLRLITAILSPVLPKGLLQSLTAGWDVLFNMVGGALPAIAAAIILGCLLWIFVGRKR